MIFSGQVLLIYKPYNRQAVLWQLVALPFQRLYPTCCWLRPQIVRAKEIIKFINILSYILQI